MLYPLNPTAPSPILSIRIVPRRLSVGVSASALDAPCSLVSRESEGREGLDQRAAGSEKFQTRVGVLVLCTA